MVNVLAKRAFHQYTVVIVVAQILEGMIPYVIQVDMVGPPYSL